MCRCVSSWLRYESLTHTRTHTHTQSYHRQDVWQFVDISGDELDVGHGGDALEVVDHPNFVAVLWFLGVREREREGDRERRDFVCVSVRVFVAGGLCMDEKGSVHG